MGFSCKKLWNKTSFLGCVNIYIDIIFWHIDKCIRLLLVKTIAHISSTMHINLNQTVECMYPWHIVNQLPYSEKVRHGKLFVLLYNMSYSQLNANSFVNFSPNRFNLYLLGKAGTAWYLLRNQNFFWNFRTTNTNLKKYFKKCQCCDSERL